VLKASNAQRGWELRQVQAAEAQRCRRADQERRRGELGDKDRQHDAGVEAHRRQAEKPGVANEEPEVAVGPRR
jgi:hypothetical protein